MTEALLAKVDTWRDHEDFTPAERRALDYAERFCEDHHTIDEGVLDGLREHFDDGEIVDLTGVVAKYLAIGRLVKVLELDHTCPLPGVETTEGP